VPLKLQVLSTSQILINNRVLHLNADQLANFLSVMLDVKPSDASYTRRLPQKSRKDLDRGALSGTVWSEKSEELAVIDIERYSLDSLRTIPVRLYQILDLNCGQL